MSALLVAVLVAGGVLFLVQALAPVQAAVAERLGRLEERPPAVRLRSGKGNPLLAIGTQVDPLLQRTRLAARLEALLAQGAVPWTPGEFAICTALCAAVGAAVGLAVVRNPAAGLLFALLGAALPFIQLERAAAKRVKALNEQLPEAILMLATALRAGNSFLQALQLLGRQIPEPLAGEIRAAVQDINWGASFEAALIGLKDRVGTVEMEMVVIASLVQRQSGGNLSEILLNVHEMVRDRIRLRGDVQALTAQGRASAVILTGLPVGLGIILFLINPGYIRVLLVDPRGQAMLACAVVMSFIGSLAIRKIVNVRY